MINPKNRKLVILSEILPKADAEIKAAAVVWSWKC